MKMKGKDAPPQKSRNGREAQPKQSQTTDTFFSVTISLSTRLAEAAHSKDNLHSTAPIQL